jgi:transposase
MRRHESSDEQWGKIKDLLPGKAGDPGRAAEDNRLFIKAVYWTMRTGAPPVSEGRDRVEVDSVRWGIKT